MFAIFSLTYFFITLNYLTFMKKNRSSIFYMRRRFAIASGAIVHAVVVWHLQPLSLSRRCLKAMASWDRWIMESRVAV